MKDHKDFIYKVGEIYLYKNEIVFDTELFNYAIKQIIEIDYSVANIRIYKYIYYCNILKREVYGWDNEKQVAEGKLLLEEYLNGKNEK